MTQTRRPLSEIMANLPDNTSGEISPRDVRDAILSVTPIRGGYYIAEDHGAATQIVTQGAWTHVAGTTSGILVSDPCRMQMTGNNEATYIEGPPLVVYFVISLGAESAASNQAFSFAPEIGGVVLEQFRAPAFYTAQDRRASVTISGQWPIEEGDTFRVMARNNTSTSNITVGTLSVPLLGLTRCVGGA